MNKVISGFKKDYNNFIISNNKFKIIISEKKFSSVSISKIYSSLTKIIELNSPKKIVIRIESKAFSDDACILVFENIIYEFLKNMKNELIISFTCLIKNILSYDYFKNSLLFMCLDNNMINTKKFEDLYCNKNIVQKKYIRKFLKNDSLYTVNNSNEASMVLQDVNTFMKGCGFDYLLSKNIAVVISEIVDNVFSHTSSDVIIYVKALDVLDNQEMERKVISVSIHNVSNIHMYTTIMEKMKKKKLNEKVESIVRKSYNNNINKFNENFNEDSFFFISTFQKNVTTREKAGGTGLTVLVQNLINCSYDDYCYVISGDNCLFLKKPFLELNQDGTIGFNNSNDYFNDIPDENVFHKLNYTLNGTLFNLAFVAKEGNNE